MIEKGDRMKGCFTKGLRKNWMLWLVLGALVVVCMLLFGTTGTGDIDIRQKEKYTVGVVTKSSSSEYWMSVCEGIKVAAEKYNMDVIILQPDRETNEEAQVKMVDTLVKKDVDMIALSPINSKDASDYIRAAADRQIPLICFDDGFDTDDVAYVGIDNRKAGYELMKYMAQQMDHKGSVGIITGPLTQRCHRLRLEGAKQYIEEEKEMTLAFVESGYSNQQMPETEIRRLQKSYPQVKGFMVTSAATAMGVVDAVAGSDVRIVSVDAQTDAVEAVKEGRMQALMAQSGYDVGYETIRYIADMREKKADPSGKILETELLTKDNVDAYLSSWKKQEEE